MTTKMCGLKREKNNTFDADGAKEDCGITWHHNNSKWNDGSFYFINKEYFFDSNDITLDTI